MIRRAPTWSCVLLVLLATSMPAGAASIGVADSGGTQDYGIGYANWATLTADLDAANDVTVIADFTSLAQILAFDALWLDQRWTQGALNPLEVLNIEAYIATGRKVVMFGDNDLWAAWNTQVLAIVAGTYDSQTSGTTLPVLAHPLTAGVSQVSLDLAGRAAGGTPLFDQNFMTLWGDNVLTVLDINFLAEAGLGELDNQVLAGNLVDWVSGPVVPVPAALPLYLSALAGLLGLRRRSTR